MRSRRIDPIGVIVLLGFLARLVVSAARVLLALAVLHRALPGPGAGAGAGAER